MCLQPKEMEFKGIYKETNYHGIKGEPYNIKVITKCGYCSQCVAEKANNWVIRNYYEAKQHEKKCFITLTYAKTNKFLVRKDFQNFIKRLRRYFEYNKLPKIRIFYAGEYGTIRKRPHYHAIIYGWKDENPTYIGLSKKGYPIMQSEIIQRKWKHGRTTYQEFNENEIPYISLYDTAKEKSAYQYRTTKKELKKRLKELERIKKEFIGHYKDQERIDNEINEIEKIIKREKQNYITIREFNGWSQSLGWNLFYEEYNKANNTYIFTEYINDKEFLTPTPWVKKLANWGLEDARKEMLERIAFSENSKLEKEIEYENNLKEGLKHVKEILKYNQEKYIDIENELQL